MTRENMVKNSWPTAFKLFLHDKHAFLLVRILRPLLVAYIPFGIFDDILPVFGWLDNIPTFLIVIYVVWRVSKYRYSPAPRKSVENETQSLADKI